MTGATVQQFLDSLREDALLNIKKGLVLDAIAKQENVEVNDEDIDAYATKLGEGYGMSLTEIKSAVPTDNLEGGAVWIRQPASSTMQPSMALPKRKRRKKLRKRPRTQQNKQPCSIKPFGVGYDE